MSRRKRQFDLAVVCAAASLCAVSAVTADEIAPAAPTIQTARPTGQIQALIGTGELQAASDAAVVRLGPADADWSDLGLPIDLPLARTAWRGRGAAAPAGDALTCLTQAVYYEARSESLPGQEGVAQVVMNRTHLGGYPTSVCNVVYQRSDRGTCQFTFACDGSMDRRLEPAAWDRAHDVANQALRGYVFKPLELATHYHASWMTPYWSSSLRRITQIGGHIFYQ